MVRLNSPMDSVNTVNVPARMPGAELGSAMVQNRVQKPAPRLAAPSSSTVRLIDDMTASTERSEEHTSELQSPMRISYAGFCLKKKTTITNAHHACHLNI